MLALGADWCNSARGFMFALGCLQAQTCHTGACPTGVTTQDPLRMKALDVPTKADRVYHFHQNTLMALKELVQAAGLDDPARSPPTTSCGATPSTASSCSPTCCRSSRPASCSTASSNLQVFRLYWPMASAHSFSATPRRPRRIAAGRRRALAARPRRLALR
jgi:hypothetical protein